MQTERDAFLLLASTLTGVSAAVVTAADGNADYFGTFVTLAGRDFGSGQGDELLKLFDTLAGQGKAPGDVVLGLLSGSIDRNPPPGFPQLAYGAMTRALSFLVLTGAWSPACNAEKMQIPSPEAYTQGLVWLIAQAHPEGNSLAAPQSWGVPPAPLTDFIGG